MKRAALVSAFSFAFVSFIAACSSIDQPPADSSFNEPTGDAEQDSRDAWVSPDKIIHVYQEKCANCHGEHYKGSAIGPSLLSKALAGGNGIGDIVASISEGNAAKGMPAWKATMDSDEIRSMAIFLLEQRSEDNGDAGMGAGPLAAIPSDVQSTERHSYLLELVAEGISHPYALAVLPNGDILFTEKSAGLSLVDTANGVTTRIQGTPTVYADSVLRGTTWAGNGWMHDVALHPDYPNNGWIYLSLGERCGECVGENQRPLSMLTLIRGRIENGQWVDQQTIWRAEPQHYIAELENGMGARIAFDNAGHVFLTVGNVDELYRGVQNLATPFGKILRLRDDGSVPHDNPFIENQGALPSIYALGFRTPQGLAWNNSTDNLWASEHGPRGGDEANVIKAGRNYGWPLTSLGIDYDGSKIDYGPSLGIKVDPEALTGPVIDWTPSLGVSNILFYQGASFPQWQNNMIVATLKKNDLIRIRLENDTVVETETVIKGLGRFRDIALDQKGRLYLLLEHLEGSRIVRMKPSTPLRH